MLSKSYYWNVPFCLFKQIFVVIFSTLSNNMQSIMLESIVLIRHYIVKIFVNCCPCFPLKLLETFMPNKYSISLYNSFIYCATFKTWLYSCTTRGLGNVLLYITLVELSVRGVGWNSLVPICNIFELSEH